MIQKECPDGWRGFSNNPLEHGMLDFYLFKGVLKKWIFWAKEKPSKKIPDSFQFPIIFRFLVIS